MTPIPKMRSMWSLADWVENIACSGLPFKFKLLGATCAK